MGLPCLLTLVFEDVFPIYFTYNGSNRNAKLFFLYFHERGSLALAHTIKFLSNSEILALQTF